MFAGAIPLLVWIALRLANVAPQTDASQTQTPLELPERVDWIAVVGGAEPSSTQFSLAQDLELARSVWGDHGVWLFGGGPQRYVQVTAPKRHDLRSRLAAFFDPRDRAVDYVPGPRAHGAATHDNFLHVADHAFSEEGPLWLYFGGHGENGERPSDAVLRLWGAFPFSVRDLAFVVENSPRPIRVVHTACFGGGFADVLFRTGVPESGATDKDRCGVFATQWDEEASGCDPNPDRGSQEGYALHFFQALEGRDRHGDSAPEVDLNADGHITLLEAHTRARVASRSLDVPTSTSERWLAHVVEAGDLEPAHDTSLPPDLFAEERHVIESLGGALGWSDEEAAQRGFAEVQLALDEHEQGLVELETELDDAFYTLRIRLLERWPGLDDPWATSWEANVREHSASIERWLEHSAEAVRYAEASTTLAEAMSVHDLLRVQHSLRRRVIEAWDTLAFARAVRAADPTAWARFERFRTCERSRLGSL